MPDENIYTAIAAIKQAADPLIRQQPTSDGVRFATIEYDDVLAAVRLKMDEHKVIAYPYAVKDLVFDTLQVGRSEHQRTRLTLGVRFTHAPSATTIEVQAVGEGTDGTGYSMSKAYTTAMKNALRFTFLLHGADEAGTEGGPRAARQQPRTGAGPGPTMTEFMVEVADRGYSPEFVFRMAGDGVDEEQIARWLPQKRAWLLEKMKKEARTR